MRIVQTFWTAGRDPLKYSFGWLHPEYNLMSWALSCLSLREHYDEVALYTDEQGKHVLIDLLHLPYTEVNVVYDEHLCLPQHWAYAKIKTYSLQTKPFLHVDGDVYLPQPIPNEILSAPLIAQNREVGTDYYRNMVDRILSCPGVLLPEYVDKRLSDKSIPSYNMGIFGGNDIGTIQSYCKNSLHLFEQNRQACDNGNINILFEQIYFAIFCEEEALSVSSLIEKVINDNGYNANDFCSLNNFTTKRLLHLLGGHKRRNDVTSELSKRLFARHRDFFLQIVNLFPARYPRLCFDEEFILMRPKDTDGISEYLDFIEDTEQKWAGIAKDELMLIEEKTIFSGDIFFSGNTDLLNKDVCIHPFCELFTIPKRWNDSSRIMLRNYLQIKNDDLPLQHIGIIPTISSSMRENVLIQDMGLEIIKQLGTEVSQVKDIINHIVSSRTEMDRGGCYYHVLSEIKYLVNNHIIIINL